MSKVKSNTTNNTPAGTNDRARKVKKIILIILLLVFEVGLLCSFPYVKFVWEKFINNNPLYTRYTFSCLAIVYIGIVLAITAIALGTSLVIKSLKENIFTHDSTKLLRIIARLFGLVGLLMIIFTIYATIVTPGLGSAWIWILVASLVFFIGDSCFLFIADLFEDAVNYREENDLTI